MNCQTFEQYLVDYLEGSLPLERRKNVDAHLRQCDQCRILLAQERSISTKLREWPSLQCPEHVVENVFAEIGRKESRVSWKERLQGWLRYDHPWEIGATAATVVVLVVIAVFYLGGDTSPVQQVTYTSEEVEQAKQDIVLTLAYVHHYTEKTGDILEHQLASTQAAVRQPVETIFEEQIESTRAAIRQPVETRIKKTFMSIIDGGIL